MGKRIWMVTVGAITRGQTGYGAIAVFCDTGDEAIGNGIKHARFLWPHSDGWSTHNADAKDITDYAIGWVKRIEEGE